jgi:DNA polymerase (family 10)
MTDPEVTDDELAALLEEMADRLEATGVEYKPNAYRRAAESVREQPRSVAELAREDPEALEDLPDVGEAIASKLAEYVDTGSIGELEELREELPVEMSELTAVEGVGPKTVGSLYEALGVADLDDLEAAAEAGEIRDVKGFGAKTEQNILEAVAFAREAGDRMLLGEARPVADEALATLRSAPEVERADVAGSIRRWKDTIGDVDVLVASEDGPAVVETFTGWDAVDDLIEAGDTKASVRVDGVRVDLRVVAPGEFGAALQYFTGSKDHNVTLRNRAIERGLKMNEYGVFDVSAVEAPDDQRAGERIAGETEASMYEALDLVWIPPELRRDTGEVEAAAGDALPDLLEEGAVRGDLHTHSDWSGDGRASIAEMVEAAAALGHDYHAVTDHLQGPGTPPSIGLEPDEVREQVDAVAEVRADAPIEVLHGVEANVGSDGEVDVPGDLVDQLDVVVASPHAALSQDSGAATERLVRAVEHDHADVLGHPSGRLLNERPGLEFDVERVAEAAAEHDTALEVNSNPHRLDLWGDAVQAAVEAGALLAVDTDAHGPDGLADVRYGVHTARRGWATEADVLNARDIEGLRAFLH